MEADGCSALFSRAILAACPMGVKVNNVRPGFGGNLLEFIFAHMFYIDF